ncbi:unnamed protein product [Vitrella brassicaformis CCMP3155]|uniref:Malate dehydrogenase n=2 Tax=Vitrella brassicaformis TaxID=1169539 RepID=A0A0G4EI69_VITBC|nr:unnamed protein product [Vitrella brassicaformis CCMP3155]|mmetsp:Transcript_15707/g.44851  ORF Transcript_15707/g.44851 Transcript_15707/m.44851 type:complete len:365 (+) Transcript_15707:40-1134(+)|eukprot:CEL96690.1 unnamed protein product [Vitrella brassicaformis CCMP3155]
MSFVSRFASPLSALSPVMSRRVAFPLASQHRSFTKMSSFTKPPVRVAVTGAAGAIGYALIFRVASGQMLGADHPVILHLIEVPQVEANLKGVKMELDDCAFPTLKGVVCTSDLEVGFGDCEYAMLVGAKPRGPGMERSDLLKDNGKIFTGQGKALSAAAKPSCKVLVVGNPANTNALIAAHNSKNIPFENFTAMTRLDHNRALTQIAQKAKCDVEDIDKFCVWGNHSPTMYPDLSHATIKGTPAKQVINDESWIKNEFYPTVQKRGAAVIDARKASSAASAANGALEHIRDWALGTGGKWTSMGVVSDDTYGLQKGLIYSYPVTCANGVWTKVTGLPVDQHSHDMMQHTLNELVQERDMVKDML